MESPLADPFYLAPEFLLTRKYDKACDLWSIGVITHVLLAAPPPFSGDSDEEIKASASVLLVLRHGYISHFVFIFLLAVVLPSKQPSSPHLTPGTFA